MASNHSHGLQSSYKICVFGESGDRSRFFTTSLKTELIHAFFQSCEADCGPLISNHLEPPSLPFSIGNEKTVLNLVDTTGKEDNQLLYTSCLSNSDVIIMAFSCGEPETFENIQKLFPQTKLIVGLAPILILGLRTELRTNFEVIQELEKKGKKAIDYTTAFNYASKMNCHYEELSVSKSTPKEVRSLFESAILLVGATKSKNKEFFKDLKQKCKKEQEKQKQLEKEWKSQKKKMEKLQKSEKNLVKPEPGQHLVRASSPPERSSEKKLPSSSSSSSQSSSSIDSNHTSSKDLTSLSSNSLPDSSTTKNMLQSPPIKDSKNAQTKESLSSPMTNSPTSPPTKNAQVKENPSSPSSSFLSNSPTPSNKNIQTKEASSSFLSNSPTSPPTKNAQVKENLNSPSLSPSSFLSNTPTPSTKHVQIKEISSTQVQKQSLSTRPHVQKSVSSPNPSQVHFDLPSNWEEVKTADGQIYYWNTVTDETRWEKPSEDLPNVSKVLSTSSLPDSESNRPGRSMTSAPNVNVQTRLRSKTGGVNSKLNPSPQEEEERRRTEKEHIERLKREEDRLKKQEKILEREQKLKEKEIEIQAKEAELQAKEKERQLQLQMQELQRKEELLAQEKLMLEKAKLITEQEEQVKKEKAQLAEKLKQKHASAPVISNPLPPSNNNNNINSDDHYSLLGANNIQNPVNYTKLNRPVSQSPSTYAQMKQTRSPPPPPPNRPIQTYTAVTQQTQTPQQDASNNENNHQEEPKRMIQLKKTADPKNVLLWKEEDVGIWLESLKLGELKNVFLQNKINGAALIELKEEDLKDELGMESLGVRKQFMSGLQDLQKKAGIQKEEAASKIQNAFRQHSIRKKGTPQRKSIIPSVAPSSIPQRPQTSSTTPQLSLDFQLSWDEIQISKQIGEGAFGAVFKGVWKGYDVAVKKYKTQRLETNVMKEFLLEASIMRELAMDRMENIVTIYGMCTTPPNMCLVTEFYPLGCLSDHFDYLKTPNEVIKFIKGIAKGMAYLHKKGITHRDLAARNILVGLNDKKEYIPKITDFGMSRFNVSDVNRTETNQFPLKWSAPESLSRFEYSEATDVWSWGVTVIEILNKGDPYPGMPDRDVGIAVRDGKLHPRIPPATKTELKNILVATFQLEPTRRPKFTDIFNTL